MLSSRLRTAVRAAAVVAASVAALLTGPMSTGASAATFFRTVESAQARLQLAVSSDRVGAPLAFVPRFDGRAACATCGVPDTPAGQAWAQQRLMPNASGVFLVNKATGRCADVDPLAQRPGVDATGTAVVLAPCDGTPSQRWRNLFAAAGNQSTFQNELNELILTNVGAAAVLEPFNSRLPRAERGRHVQVFGSVLVSVR